MTVNHLAAARYIKRFCLQEIFPVAVVGVFLKVPYHREEIAVVIDKVRVALCTRPFKIVIAHGFGLSLLADIGDEPYLA